MLRSATAVGLAVFTSGALFAASIGERFHRTYASLRSLSCTFTDGRGLQGTLSAIKGGKYRVALPDRSMISDGTSVWNVTPSTKTVIINALRSNASSDEDLSIERMFFTLMAVYRVKSEQRVSSTTVLRLVPPSSSATIGGIVWADVTVDASMNVRRITVNDGTATSTWTINALRRNVTIPARTFSYTPPPNWQVIDLR